MRQVQDGHSSVCGQHATEVPGREPDNLVLCGRVLNEKCLARISDGDDAERDFHQVNVSEPLQARAEMSLAVELDDEGVAHDIAGHGVELMLVAKPSGRQHAADWEPRFGAEVDHHVSTFG